MAKEDLSRSPSVRMSKNLDRRLNIVAAREEMPKTKLIREVLGVAIEDLEADGLDGFRACHESASEQDRETEKIEID